MKTVRNQVIFKEGESLQYVYFVKRGEFKAVKKNETCIEKDELIRQIIEKNLSNSETKIIDPYKMSQLSSAR